VLLTRDLAKRRCGLKLPPAHGARRSEAVPFTVPSKEPGGIVGLPELRQPPAQVLDGAVAVEGKADAVRACIAPSKSKRR
jgi:hypothetical protein